MSGVDDRIVSMKFDNEAFERKLSDTLKSLDKLRQSLDFANSKRGMDELSNAGKSFNMGNMGAVVDGVTARFSALSTVAITTLATITHHAVTSAGRVLKAFTLAPITDGFREFETNMNSIQTILANTKAKGSTLEDVNGALQKLNQYSDQTIYNFAQMARNIGTFTAAGVDLDDSVNAIKGIANLAAISGSNSEQASTAMYQLSQALAAGKVSLMDWNSVVNAGMGGEIFKKALFETGKAMKTITDVPVGASFEEWEKKGGTFREQMEKGWITADVLKTTLGAFSGDLNEASLKALGFGDAAAKQMIELGALGISAATEVKTLTQLMGTVKESVASGWSQSFKTVIGDFEESKELFTSINRTIGSFVSESADARNNLLQGWKDLGGRTLLIEGFKDALNGIAFVLQPIKDAFREIFPPKTAQQLFEMTQRFANFTAGLRLGTETMSEIKRAFAGMFAVVEIGWEIFKGILGLIGDVLNEISFAAGGSLRFAASFGDTLVALNKKLVEGGGIRDFFKNLSEGISKAGEFISDFRTNISKFFESFSAIESTKKVLDGLEDRFSGLARVSDRLSSAWDNLSGVFEKVKNIFDKIWNYISTWFSELGRKLADVMAPGDFNAAIDVVNVGLLGGIVLMLKKFLNNGLNIDIGGGLISKITNTFDELTGTLKAMQTELKSKALLNIAIAVGVLTASILVLSLIDSAALSKALVAMTVGFGQLIGAMTLLDRLSISTSAVKLNLLAVGMIFLAGAVVVLSVAIKNLSSLGWEELAKGLLGVTVALIALTKSTQLIATDTAGLIRAGIAMSAMAASLLILSVAVKSFAELSWAEMAKGLVGVGIGLAILVTAMNLMPPNMIASGLALIAISVGMRILAEAVQAFGDISWGEMTKGILGIAVSLTLIGIAMNLMPPHMIAISAGLLLVSVSLNIMAKAIEAMGSMGILELVKGIGALAAVLGLLAIGLTAMTGTAAGSASLLVASGALLILSTVIKRLGNLSIAKIVTGLAAIAGVMIILGGSAYILAPLIPVMTSLGGALLLLGASFAVFGVGAMLVAKAFEIMAQVGKAGVIVLIEVIKVLIAALPEFVSALIQSLIKTVDEFVNAGSLLLKSLAVLLGHMLDTVIELAPKIAEAIGAIISAGITLLRAKFPELLQAGAELLMKLLQGIRDNIMEITVLAIQIVTNFAVTLTQNAQKLVDSAVSLLFSFIGAIANRANDIVKSGLGLLTNFLNGIANNLYLVINAAGNIILSFIEGTGKKANEVINAGVDVIVKFIKGIGDNLIRVTNAAVDVIVEFISGIDDNALKIINAAADMLGDFLEGLAKAIRTNSKRFRDAGVDIAAAIIDGMTFGLASKAKGVADKAVDVAKGALGAVTGFLGIKSPSKMFQLVGENMAQGMAVGLDNNISAEQSVVNMAERVVNAFQETLNKIPDSLSGMDNFNPIITPVLDLSKIQTASKNIDRLMAVSSIVPDVSYTQARLISSTTDIESENGSDQVSTGPTEVTFEQNIYSPTALSTNDIYRNTKSQIAMAKEELDIS